MGGPEGQGRRRAANRLRGPYRRFDGILVVIADLPFGFADIDGLIGVYLMSASSTTHL